MTTHHLHYKDVEARATRLASDLRMRIGEDVVGVYGVPRGGLVPAAIVAGILDLPLLDAPGPGCIVVDDLVDSGRTLERVLASHHLSEGEVWTAPLYRKSYSPVHPLAEDVPDDAWLVFPWEAGEQAGPTDAVVRILEHIGEDPTREGLLDTPSRVVKAFTELTVGYAQDPAQILSTTFEGEGCDEMVVVPGITFTSLCEHHLLPFVGTATVGYIPDGRIVGLSKLPRLVECYARRLQVQERMTRQVADAIDEQLHPKGVGVVVRAHHSCMSCRGVRQSSAQMVTSATLGLFRDDPRARAEFLALAHG